jgi:hypothetical protein
VSGSPLQCAQLHQRIGPLRGPCLDGGRHLPVNAPAYGGDPGHDQLLGDGAVKAWQLVSGAGAQVTKQSWRVANQSWAACDKLY